MFFCATITPLYHSSMELPRPFIAKGIGMSSKLRFFFLFLQERKVSVPLSIPRHEFSCPIQRQKCRFLPFQPTREKYSCPCQNGNEIRFLLTLAGKFLCCWNGQENQHAFKLDMRSLLWRISGHEKLSDGKAQRLKSFCKNHLKTTF